MKKLTLLLFSPSLMLQQIECGKKDMLKILRDTRKSAPVMVSNMELKPWLNACKENTTRGITHS